MNTPELTGKHCQCTACGEYFAGEEYFDRHRMGDYTSGRRCLTPTEMLSAGFVEDDAGCWCVAQRAQRAARHWREGKTGPSGTKAMQPHPSQPHAPEMPVPEAV